MDYYVVSDKAKRDASSAWTRAYRTLSGSQKVERVDRTVC
jgi:alkaline phosphatase D